MKNTHYLNLMAEFHLSSNSFPDKLTDIQIICNDNGIFVNGGWWAHPSQKVTNIFLNNLQLRLYMGEKYFMISEEGCKKSGFSFQEIYTKLEEAFILT